VYWQAYKNLKLNHLWQHPHEFLAEKTRRGGIVVRIHYYPGVEVYERLRKKAAELQQEIPGYVKKIIEKNL